MHSLKNIQTRFPVEKRDIIERSALSNDVHQLLSSFVQIKSFLLSDFINVFHELKFEAIHLNCLNKTARSSFMLELNAHFLKYFYRSELEWKVAALFGLFCIFQSQPIESTFQIQITNEIHSIWQSMVSSGHLDVIWVLKYFYKERNALLFVSYYETLEEFKFYIKEIDFSGRFPSAQLLHDNFRAIIQREMSVLNNHLKSEHQTFMKKIGHIEDLKILENNYQVMKNSVISKNLLYLPPREQSTSASEEMMKFIKYQENIFNQNVPQQQTRKRKRKRKYYLEEQDSETSEGPSQSIVRGDMPKVFYDDSLDELFDNYEAYLSEQ